MALHERRLDLLDHLQAPSLLSDLENSVALRELFVDLANYACTNAIFLPDLPYPDVDPGLSHDGHDILIPVNARANLGQFLTHNDIMRARSVYDTHVHRARILNCNRPSISFAKRRAMTLGLTIKVGEAKRLSWNEVQEFPPSVLTFGPESSDATDSEKGPFPAPVRRSAFAVLPMKHSLNCWERCHCGVIATCTPSTCSAVKLR